MEKFESRFLSERLLEYDRRKIMGSYYSRDQFSVILEDDPLIQ